MARLQRSAEINPERIDDILRSHIIEPAAIRSDDFENFFMDRMMTMLEIIEDAMGKAPASDVTLGIVPDVDEEVDEDTINDD